MTLEPGLLWMEALFTTDFKISFNSSIVRRMYPSGSWRGFWDQALYGRQPMRELVLHFSSGAVEGSGVDVVGPFTLQGTYESNGRISLIKRYRYHTVNYVGQYDGEGTIYG